MRLRSTLISLVLFSLLGGTYWIWTDSRPLHIPENLGNWPRITEPLVERPLHRPLSFAVVGDTKSFGTFTAIMKKLNALDLDFIVILGDFAHNPTQWDHRYFIKSMTHVVGPTTPPVLLVPGNHDVDPATFPTAAFERLYGPSTFTFECGGNLFVVLCNVIPRREGGINKVAYLRKILSGRQKDVRRVFVLMHRPPFDPDKPMEPLRKFKFLRLMEYYGVDYVICGDYHRYARVQVGSTVMLVSGGGGARLEGGPLGTFHHAVVIRVCKDHVTEEIVAVSPVHHLNEKLDYIFSTRVLPTLGKLIHLEPKVTGVPRG